MTGVAKKTVMRVLVEAGQVCESYQDRAFRRLPCGLIQLDELWVFNYFKAKTVTAEIAKRVPSAVDIWLRRIILRTQNNFARETHLTRWIL